MRHPHARPDLAPFVALLIALALLATACNRPATIQTPAGQVVYTLNEVAKRVERLQATVIEAEAAKAIPTNVARILITFTVEEAKLLAVAPQGWQTTIAVAWARVKGQVPIRYLNDPAIQTAILAVDTILTIWVPATAGGDA